MKRMLVLLFGIILSTSIFSNTMYPFETKKQEAQFDHLLRELRCLVCQNQDLVDSNAGLAKDLRDEVYHWVLLGKTDSEIIDFLTDRYGDFILFNPPVKAVTAFLWMGPAVFLLIGLGIFWFSCHRRKGHD